MSIKLVWCHKLGIKTLLILQSFRVKHKYRKPHFSKKISTVNCSIWYVSHKSFVSVKMKLFQTLFCMWFYLVFPLLINVVNVLRQIISRVINLSLHVHSYEPKPYSSPWTQRDSVYEKMNGNCLDQLDIDKKKLDTDDPIAMLKNIYSSCTWKTWFLLTIFSSIIARSA